MTAARRVVITVCPLERGVVRLPLERGGVRRRLDARAVLRELTALIARRRLEAVVTVRAACAGGCLRAGPNVGVTVHAMPRPGQPADDVAIGWTTYVHRLGELDCLAAIIDENLGTAPVAQGRRRPAVRTAPRRSRRPY